jgi:hypothetical protein
MNVTEVTGHEACVKLHHERREGDGCEREIVCRIALKRGLWY